MFNEMSSNFEHRHAQHVEFLMGFLCYTYPGSILVDIIFRKKFPGCMMDTTIIVVYTICFALCQSKRFNKFIKRPWIMLCIRAIWAADAQRLSLLMLERAVWPNPTFRKGLWVSMCFWMSGPCLRSMEWKACNRHLNRESRQPLYLLLIPGCIALMYLSFLMWFSNCNTLSATPMSMSRCVDEHGNVYALPVYIAMLFSLTDGILTHINMTSRGRLLHRIIPQVQIVQMETNGQSSPIQPHHDHTHTVSQV